MCNLILQVPQVEFFFNNPHTGQPAAPQGGEPFKTSKALRRAALAYAQAARKAAFFSRGPSAQPRGQEIQLEFYGRPQQGIADITNQGTFSLSAENIARAIYLWKCSHSY
jgi:hypothetical protein